MSDIAINIAKAKAEAAQGDERLKGSVWERMTKDTIRFSEAAQHYSRAGNFYRLAKQGLEAGQMFQKAAEIFLKVDEKHEASGAFENAAKSYQLVDNQLSIPMFEARIQLLLDEGQIAMAARSEKDIAEMFEKEKDLEKAVKHYEKAQSYFQTSTTNASGAAGCASKVAHLLTAVEPPRYDRAAEVFESMGRKSAGKTSSYSAKEYFFKAALCRLAAGDIVGAKRSIDSYGSDFFEWPNTKESLFLSSLIGAIENYDVDEFTAAVQDWNSTCSLDAWRTSVLLKIKEEIPVADETNLL
eukprot:TRINITY_DN2583_c0_g1_i1.p1 TRINITY_DN2583_c0_g1~~TRINITY_DN2583_c0_g1_i1.p1  ORF type:complete len:298 (-),score=67.61 TRINITY_DN2583_c0_g1_i1:1274-2167(-)